MVKGLGWGQTGGRCFPELLQRLLTERHKISCCKKMCNFGISGALWIGVRIISPTRPRTESCHRRNKLYMVCYSFGRTSGLLIGPFVLCNFHWWFAWSSNAWKLCVIICWRLQNIQDYKLSSWSFRISVRLYKCWSIYICAVFLRFWSRSFKGKRWMYS